MPRPKEMPRPSEKQVDKEDAELLAQAKGCANLSPEEQEKVHVAEAHLSQYGKLTSSDRETLKRLAKSQ